MKFGKINEPDALSKVDFSLPPIPEETKVNLAAYGESGPVNIYLGCPMWGNKAWVGKLYPKGTKPGDFLEHYARTFNGIELNSTHYRIPTGDMVARWYEQASVNPEFRFSPKIPQFISHRFQLINCEAPLRDFTDAIAGFKELLGCSFVQLPPAFGFDKVGNLRTFFEMWPNEFPLAIEFRDVSWFEGQRLRQEARELLSAFRINALITDVSGRRDVCHMDITHDTLMLRFVGNEMIQSDYDRADAWVNRIAECVPMGLRNIYLFIHEPDSISAPEMGIYFIQKLNKALGLHIHEPVLGEIPGAQMSLF